LRQLSNNQVMHEYIDTEHASRICFNMRAICAILKRHLCPMCMDK